MSHNYPIVLGHKFKKGILALRHGEGGFRFLICRLKKEYQTGDQFQFKDIESVEKEIWFADRESLEMTVGLMNKVLKDWRVSNEDERNS